jgi:hypothetical protein
MIGWRQAFAKLHGQTGLLDEHGKLPAVGAREVSAPNSVVVFLREKRAFHSWVPQETVSNRLERIQLILNHIRKS